MAFEPFPHGFAPVVDGHHTGIIVGAGDLRGIQRIAVSVKEKCKVMDKHGKFTEGSAVPAPDHRLGAAL